MANDPNLRWDGQQWSRWDGAQWVPVAQQGAPQYQIPAPQNRPPPSPKSKGNKGWIIGGSVAAGSLVVSVVVAVLIAVNSSNNPGGSAGSVGQPVRDGNLEFTVTETKVVTDGFANGAPSSGHEYFVASVTVKDIGTGSESLSPVDQVAVVGASRYNGFAFVVNSESSGSGTGTLAPETLLLTPGATTSLQIPWNPPTGIKVSYLLLHTSGSSSGARINID